MSHRWWIGSCRRYVPNVSMVNSLPSDRRPRRPHWSSRTGVAGASVMPASCRALRQDVDELLELAEVAALERAVAVGAVLPHDRIAGVPVGLRLGVQPVQVTGALLDLLEHPALRGVVVVPLVAEDHDGVLRGELLAVPLPEHLD